MIITGLYAAPLSILLVVLVLRVVRLRVRNRIGIGDGGNSELQRAIRVHGNFIETVPWAILLMAIMETTQALPDVGLHVYGATLIVARLAHAWGLTKGIGLSVGRTGGIVLTTILFVVAAGACVMRYFA